MITITLRGDPGMRTGTVQIDNFLWIIASWHRQSGGEIHATTNKATRVRLVMDEGRGGITIGADWWVLHDCKWTGQVMTGTATPGDRVTRVLSVSDAEMANMFPDCSWG